MSEGYFLKPLKIFLMVIGALTCIGALGYWGMNSVARAMLGDVETEIVQVKSSPDGLVVATLRRSNSGATNPYVYRVSLQVNGKEDTEKLVAMNLDSIQIEWKSSDLLSVVMPCGEVSKFMNFERVHNTGDTRTVELRLTTNGRCRDRE